MWIVECVWVFVFDVVVWCVIVVYGDVLRVRGVDDVDVFYVYGGVIFRYVFIFWILLFRGL